ncbi:MAG: hypothetical protein EBZ59_11145, partial [Planctomycetia bacterium]|nr:hypothetical protein [Planctomycetia bacterium]
MRLTLRTLLAWLDDVLPVEEKAELDGRVAASPVTPQLIERIRHVVEQPVLSAPPPTGRGLGGDPNTVAEFLDNSLASEQLKAFERICLESDVHLAEVAACHGILAAAARDPQVWLPLDEAGRHHLLGAMKHRSALLAAAAQRREALATARMMQEANGIEANGRGADERPESAQPAAAAASSPVGAGGRRSSTMAWVSAIAAVTLLAALAGVLGRTLGCGADRGRQVA